VRMKTPLCEDWRKKHNNVCSGCTSEPACTKANDVLRAFEHSAEWFERELIKIFPKKEV
jgi:hypothetical protein